MDMRAVLTYGDKQALGRDIVETNDTGNLEGMGIYREGFSGKVAGFNTLFTQQLPALTTGTRVASGTSVLNYGSGDPENDYEDVAISPAPGQFKTGLINMDGQTGAVTLVDGETFTIEGVYAYDNRASASTTCRSSALSVTTLRLRVPSLTFVTTRRSSSRVRTRRL